MNIPDLIARWKLLIEAAKQTDDDIQYYSGGSRHNPSAELIPRRMMGPEGAELLNALKALIAREAVLSEALRAFVGSAYPVAEEINPRGHNWSEAYLDQAIALARTALTDGGKGHG